jgi:hypothetical protein
MKKTNLDHKLKLTTETLIPLQADVLDGVAGGGTTATVKTIITALTCRTCVHACLTGAPGGNGNGSL